ncbi:glycosyltransferase [Geminicoccaceae bacterium 1502E]|nr:glycosyltransferase [Geminicoccaceae bacterium 1502E]
MTVRILFWVQHLLGSGHLRRALSIAAALAGRGAEVTLASGGAPLPWAAPPGVRVVQLPVIRAEGGRIGRLVDGSGAPVGERQVAGRRAMLLGLLAELRPQLVLTEMFPFGRRGFRGELLPLLEAARAMRPRPSIVCSLRDVLVSKRDPARTAAMRDLCRAFYDRVLVHADPRLVPLGASFPHAGELADLLAYTGYVHVGGRAAPAAVRRGVLVSAGGGAVGARLLRAAVQARRLVGGEEPWLLLTGANAAPSLLEELGAAAGPGLAVERHRDDVPALLAACAVSVSQAGYNTVVEALVAGASMVLVPFAAPGEDEQTLRARRLAAIGMARHLEEAGLTPEALAGAVRQALAEPTAAPGRFDTDGAGRSAGLLMELAGGAVT